MKTLMVNTGWMVTRFVFMDDDKALAGYGAIKDAMAKYERFKNQDSQIVSIDGDNGELTFKIEGLVAASIEDLSEAADDHFVQNAIRNARIQAKVEAKVPSIK